MFEFRIINCTNGTQVIDHSLKTPYAALTPVQMEEYMEVAAQIAVMERMRMKARREENHKRRLEQNPFYKLACICGIV